MIPAISSFIIIFSIWILTISFVVADKGLTEFDGNLTRHIPEWKSERAKRSLSDEVPHTLYITVRPANGRKIKLVWKLETHFLANENLPLVLPFGNSNLNVMDDVGRFVTYYDRNECSAVVYFEKMKALYGAIGRSYFISNLPFNFDDNGIYTPGIVGEPYLMKPKHQSNHIFPMLDPPPPSDVEAWNDFLHPVNNPLTRGTKRPATCEPGPSGKLSRVEQNRKHDGRNANRKAKPCGGNHAPGHKSQTYFLEILVFVTRDVVETFKQCTGTEHLSWAVRYFIIYFNVVQLIFQKMTTAKDKLAINLAKIEFEDELMPFPFVSRDKLEFSETVTKLPEYLMEHRAAYPPDSFDHVLIYSSRIIMDGAISVNALTRHGADLYEARKENRFYDVVPITLMTFQDHLADYVYMVHEIGRTLNLKIEPDQMGMKSMGQCYAIMQRGGAKCENCFRWSVESEEQFNLFFKENRNRCFLLNEPRSLRVPGMSKFLTPQRQCRCFGFDHYRMTPSGIPKKRVTETGCREPLQCSKRYGLHFYDSLTVKPFDGTLCTARKVCWNGTCQLLPVSAFEV